MLKETNNINSICHCEEHSATRQSHEIASHSFRMTQCETGRSTPSLSFPCLTRESIGRGLNVPRCAQYAQSGRSSPTCHPWTSASEIRGSTWCGLNAPHFTRFAQSGRSTTLLSFPCLTRESTWRGLNAPHFTRFAQSGRSMVEMLGVLAVMGVLSVGGVAMYTSAMNKYRANELLNEASKRAVVVVPQIAMGNTPSIGEFTNPSDHNFELKGPDGTNAWQTTDKQFAITISGVSKEICQQMKNVSGGVIKGFKPDTCADNSKVILTFNNDMSTEDLPSGPADVGVCEEGKVYLSYNSDPCGTETPMNTQSCTSGSDCWDGMGDASCCDTTTHTCKAGTYYYDEDSGNEDYRCVEADNKQCTKNSDCASGEFCNLMSSEWDCYKPNTGTCEAISSSDYTDATVTGLGSVRRSNGTTTWWAAENWCKAQGKNLIDVSKFKVYKTTNKTTAASGLLTSGAETWSYGCADGKKCGYWNNSPYSAMWSGNTLVETAGDSDGLYKDRYSPVLISLRQEFDSNSLYFWTASDYSSSDSCSAFYVGLGRGDVNVSVRDDYNYYYALCE